jgi:homoserine dehydrogenase
LATVRGANNAVFVEGPAIGQLFFMGPGAGGDPTATAALGDVIDAGREFLAGTKVVPRIRLGEGRIVDFSEVATKWYLRLIVKDQPGVLASIASIFGENDVSIKQMWQEGRGSEATLLIITHDASESCHRAAVEGLRDLDTVRQVAARLRVVSSEP